MVEDEERNLVIFLHRIKNLGDQKEKEKERKRFEVSKPTPDPQFSCVWVGENPKFE